MRFQNFVRPLLVSLVLVSGAFLITAASLKEAAASTKSSLQLAGRVPARASVWLSRTASLFPMSRRKLSGNGKLLLTELDVSANNKSFSIRLLSGNAELLGAPGLVDQVNGESVPYNLTFGGREVRFVDGEASLPSDREATDPVGPQRLEIELGENESLAGGSYEEKLLVVIAAR